MAAAKRQKLNGEAVGTPGNDVYKCNVLAQYVFSYGRKKRHVLSLKLVSDELAADLDEEGTLPGMREFGPHKYTVKGFRAHFHVELGLNCELFDFGWAHILRSQPCCSWFRCEINFFAYVERLTEVRKSRSLYFGCFVSWHAAEAHDGLLAAGRRAAIEQFGTADAIRVKLQ
jgi:hypothetical protein